MPKGVPRRDFVTGVLPLGPGDVMGSHTRSIAARVGRALLFVVGVLGAFAVIDAVLLFVFVLAAMIVWVPNPYMGLVLFVGAPLIAIAGGALAAVAYAVLKERTQVLQAGEHHHAHT